MEQRRKGGCDAEGARDGPVVGVKCWDVVPSEMRKLIFEGRKAFRYLENVSQDASDLNPGGEDDVVLSQSASLRASLDSCTRNLEDRCVAAGEGGQVVDFMEKMKVASSVWHLCELMVLDPSVLVVYPFTEWVYDHYPRFVDLDANIQDVKRLGSRSECFWSLVFYFVLKGDLFSAWNTLALHDRFKIAKKEDKIYYLFQDVRVLLLSMPRLGSKQGVNGEKEDVELWQGAEVDIAMEVEFKTQWTTWHESVSQFVSEFHGVISELDGGKLFDVLSIVRGNVEKMMEYLDGQLDSWTHLLAATLLYHAPSCRKDKIKPLATQCMNWGSRSHMDEMLVAIFDVDMSRFIQLLHQNIGDRWVEAHLVDLLARKRAIETVSLNREEIEQSDFFEVGDFMLGDHEVDVREYFIIQYALQVGLGGRQVRRNAHFPGAW
eukprot:CAMPEP_0203743878 /NCGR_PEP_ID=MMETSP0098-20131031/129_1 /ASSEMBLY_ACC=CAM_ASM_000208 /TAXON_ID=96639 /ORGANISM=" , Strain NY0313808BC1" /LENGTH=432 /DNA_ID=CAMNT_0050631223 /DNA_START=215 /DNA_END=1510 /DNA_ORIENTATION=-